VRSSGAPARHGVDLWRSWCAGRPFRARDPGAAGSAGSLAFVVRPATHACQRSRRGAGGPVVDSSRRPSRTKRSPGCAFRPVRRTELARGGRPGRDGRLGARFVRFAGRSSPAADDPDETVAWARVSSGSPDGARPRPTTRTRRSPGCARFVRLARTAPPGRDTSGRGRQAVHVRAGDTPLTSGRSDHAGPATTGHEQSEPPRHHRPGRGPPAAGHPPRRPARPRPAAAPRRRCAAARRASGPPRPRPPARAARRATGS